MKKIVPVILCGGSGSRLWPASREGLPKQFIELVGNKTLFQRSFLRLVSAIDNSLISKILVVTNEEHKFHVLEQLESVNNGMCVEIIVEPAPKNTAPALIMASILSINDEEDSILVVSPSDHIIDDVEFKKSLSTAIEEAANNSIVTLGIKPSRPETGYGYIKYEVSENQAKPHNVIEFKEKPTQDIAEKYLADSCYLWNSGLFILKARICNEAFSFFSNDLYENTKKAVIQSSKQDSFIMPCKDLFLRLKPDSIDYSLMEKCTTPDSKFVVKTVELSSSWSDLGTWSSVWDFSKLNDENGNALKGDVIAIDTKNSLVFSDNRLITTLGLENIIVVETSDSVLVSDMKDSANIKKIFDHIKSSERKEHKLHTKVYRPWGWYDSVENGEGFQVKRINVKPGAKLSLQSHKFRSEHWTVIKGKGEVTVNENVSILSVDESVYIPLGATHRLCNPGIDDLEIIEVQIGSYLGEDDIERYDDTYGRLNDS